MHDAKRGEGGGGGGRRVSVTMTLNSLDVPPKHVHLLLMHSNDLIDTVSVQIVALDHFHIQNKNQHG